MEIKKDPENIIFNSSWSLWYHKIAERWEPSAYEKIITFYNLKEYFTFFNNIEKLGGITASHYFLMRGDIAPVYEHEANKGNYAWTLMVSRTENGRDNCEGVARKCWEEITLRALGETLVKESHNINGITINVKEEGIIIQIWTSFKNPMNENILPNTVLQMSKKIKIKKLINN